MTQHETTRPYQPCNGTEGEIFMSRFCFACDKDKREDRPCRILGRSMAFNVGDPEYPKEWVMDAEGWPGNPRCTAFVVRGTVDRPAPPTIIKDKRQIGLAL